jgi:hypothetical protein
MRKLNVGTQARFNLSKLVYTIVDISDNRVTLKNNSVHSCELDVAEKDFDKHFTVLSQDVWESNFCK